MIDWTKPIETGAGREARLIGAINSEAGVRWVVATASYDGHFEEIGVSNADGRVKLAAGGIAQVRNVPPPPVRVLVTLYRNTATGVVKAFVLHRPCSDWQRIGTAWVVEGQFVEGEGLT
jgi:hypothetical protein